MLKKAVISLLLFIISYFSGVKKSKVKGKKNLHFTRKKCATNPGLSSKSHLSWLTLI